MKKNNIRAACSKTMAGALILLALSGLILLSGSHQGPPAEGRNGVPLMFMAHKIHELGGLLFILLSALHAYLNRKTLVSYFKK